MKVIMFPGQGSQYRGMGKGLFEIYRKETMQASEILGYDIEELCIKDPQKQLGKTAFTQPALYVVNAFTYYKQYSNSKPDYLIGHSLGEYNALLAAGAFSFETGLKLVKKRGELMAAASDGAMAAVLGLQAKELEQKLKQNYPGIEIANYNTPSQLVIAGKQEAINKIVSDFEAEGIKIIPLFVSAPFHSTYMKPAAEEFSTFLNNFKFSPLQIPVIANATAMPYQDQQIACLLSNQIASAVKWTDTIRLLMGKNITAYEEIGGTILTKMVNEIKENTTAIFEHEETTNEEPGQQVLSVDVLTLKKCEEIISATALSLKLGSEEFRKDYKIKYAYLAGAMYNGIASKELVIRMAKAGMLGFLGTGGMSLTELEKNIQFIQSELSGRGSYGMNLLHNIEDAVSEMNMVELFLQYRIQHIEAAAYMQINESLVYYRLKGLEKSKDGTVICNNKIVAKVSRPEVAEVFMRPAPEKIVNKLLNTNLISKEQAELSKTVPMSHDICAEADSGGHTDRGVALTLLPSIQYLRSEIQQQYKYAKQIRVGLAGGIGTLQAIASAFIMDADFVLTGSINQCTVEAGTSDLVKDLLQEINVQDTDYAPAGNMFEVGAKMQVLKKGVLFAARANKLYALYTQYESIDEIPVKTIEQLEKNYFKKPINAVWDETKMYFINSGKESEIAKAERNPKHKMALIFRWYFSFTSKIAFEGNIDEKANFQIHTGSSLGAFNQWIKGSDLESWKNRNVDKIAIKMMESAARLFKDKLSIINR